MGFNCVAGVSKNLRVGNGTGRKSAKKHSLSSPTEACSLARPLFRSLVRSPPGKRKETAATQASLQSLSVGKLKKCMP